MYDELMMTTGSRRGGLNQNLALKGQYERALQDLADLLETGREKMAGDQKIIVSSKEDIQQLLDKHKVKKKKQRERKCSFESTFSLTDIYLVKPNIINRL